MACDDFTDFVDHAELPHPGQVPHPFVRNMLFAVPDWWGCAQARFVDQVDSVALTLGGLEEVGTAGDELQVSLVDENAGFFQGLANSRFERHFSKLHAAPWEFPQASAGLRAGVPGGKFGIGASALQEQDAQIAANDKGNHNPLDACHAGCLDLPHSSSNQRSRVVRSGEKSDRSGSSTQKMGRFWTTAENPTFFR